MGKKKDNGCGGEEGIEYMQKERKKKDKKIKKSRIKNFLL